MVLTLVAHLVGLHLPHCMYKDKTPINSKLRIHCEQLHTSMSPPEGGWLHVTVMAALAACHCLSVWNPTYVSSHCAWMHGQHLPLCWEEFAALVVLEWTTVLLSSSQLEPHSYSVYEYVHFCMREVCSKSIVHLVFKCVVHITVLSSCTCLLH